MKTKLVILILFIYSSLLSQSNNINIEEYTLDNGLKILMNEDHSLPIVVVDICYHVGSKNENPDRTGFAHLFEHLMFDGSLNVKRGEFDKYIYGAGGDDNAFTSEDVTNYYDLLPSSQLELAFWLESDRMLQFAIKEISLNTQKEVVKEERKQTYENRPYGTVHVKFPELCYSKHPYRWPVIGYVSGINSATLVNVRKFFETYYVPNNATMAIVGDFDKKSTLELIKKYFSSIPKGKNEIVRPNITESKRNKQIKEVVEDKITLPGLFVAFNVPKQNSKEGYALDLLSDILTKGESSRLYKKFVDNDQTVVSISSGAELKEDSGIFTFSLFSNEKKGLDVLEKELFDEIEKIKKSGIDENELIKMKNNKEFDLTTRLKTFLGRAVALALDNARFNDPNLINNEIKNYLSISKEDIQNVAIKYFNKESSVVLNYVPEKKQ